MRLRLIASFVAVACLSAGIPILAAQKNGAEPVSVQTGAAVRVVDGDTLRIGDQRIRLWGFDAPERQQSCMIDGVDRNRGRIPGIVCATDGLVE
jgi:endonuclease YncB( thermonuclease family)